MMNQEAEEYCLEIGVPIPHNLSLEEINKFNTFASKMILAKKEKRIKISALKEMVIFS